jgi:Domain of unknown function (DUF4384)
MKNQRSNKMSSFINNFKPRVLLAVSLIFVLTSMFGMAQKKVSAAKKQEARERAMVIKNYKEKAVDGLVVKLLDRKGNAVDPGASFKSGDEMKISLISNFGGYVYFVNVTPGGKTKVFWNTRVEADEEYTLPQGKDVIAFDNEKGTEIFKVILSPTKIEEYETALMNSGGELGKTAESVAAELGGKPKTDNKSAKDKGKDKGKNSKAAPGEAVGIVQPTESGTRCRGLGFDANPTMRCRGLSFAATPEDKEKGTVVAISDKQGKMKSGDVAVFELRLKHI